MCSEKKYICTSSISIKSDISKNLEAIVVVIIVAAAAGAVTVVALIVVVVA